MNEPILIPTGTSGPRARAWNDQLWDSGGQRSKSHEALETPGSLAEASFLTLLGWTGFLIQQDPAPDPRFVYLHIATLIRAIIL